MTSVSDRNGSKDGKSNPFNFPFPPYSQQLDLMSVIYNTISNKKKFAICESPTGTGKSLSIICSTLTWLLEEEERVVAEINEKQKSTALVPTSSMNGSNNNNKKPFDIPTNWLDQFVAKANTVNESVATNENSAFITTEKTNSNIMKAKKEYDNMIEYIKEARKHKAIINKSSHRTDFFGDSKKRKAVSTAGEAPAVDNNDGVSEELAFLMDDYYDSDDDNAAGKSQRKNKHSSGGDDFKSTIEENSDDEAEDVEYLLSKQLAIIDLLNLPQIIYCARTHSQLLQFMQEVQKTVFNTRQQLRCLVLGSRKTMCVNEQLTSKHSNNNNSSGGIELSLDERCLEMQQSGSKTASTAATNNKKAKSSQPPNTSTATKKTSINKCPYHSLHRERQFVPQLFSSINTNTSTAYDIEDVMSSAREQHTCLYYSTRHATQYSQLLCMPYTTLFSAAVRRQTNLHTANRVIIVDEAHNLVDAINGMHSVEIKYSAFEHVLHATRSYLKHFQSKLNHKNVYYLNLLQSAMKKLRDVVDAFHKRQRQQQQQSDTNNPATATATATVSPDMSTDEHGHSVQSFSVNGFLFHSSLDQLNFLRLQKFLDQHHFIHRISGFMQHITGTSSTHVNYKALFRQAVSFMSCFSQEDVNGKLFVHYGTATFSDPANTNTSTRVTVSGVEQASMKYVLLNPSAAFQQVLSNARTVVLLGGTMQPFHYYIHNLLASAKLYEDLVLFSCSHIVPRSHIKPFVVSSTCSQSSPLSFTHSNRYSPLQTEQLFSVLQQVCSVVPQGVVVFFTSYQYMQLVVSRWRSNGSFQLLQSQSRKQLFVEESSNASNNTNSTNNTNTDGQGGSVWSRYQQAIQTSSNNDNASSNGAILFAVMAGRLSEGINFSDDLARCVIIVGMPYFDQRDVVMQEKVKYMQQLQLSSPVDTSNVSGQQGSPSLLDLYCMRVVNQCIGRSIRHLRDYASILLLDDRYRQRHVLKQLPQWIQQSLPAVTLQQLHNNTSNTTSSASGQGSVQHYPFDSIKNELAAFFARPPI